MAEILTVEELQEKANDILKYISIDQKVFVERQLNALPIPQIQILMKALKCNIENLVDRVYANRKGGR